MNILITGASGFIGSFLLKDLLEDPRIESINILSRNSSRKPNNDKIKYYTWDPDKNIIDSSALLNRDVIIHLAGENIANKRWNQKQKNHILNSRQKSTQLLVDEIKKNNISIKKFISASAIGIYGNRGEELITEDSQLGKGFLAEVCAKWEAPLEQLPGIAINIRIGMVLSDKGGALKKMLPAFKLGLGGRLGKGKQYISWIHIKDLIRIIEFLMHHKTHHKVYNAVAPSPVTNHVFTKHLATALKKPAIFHAPSLALKLMLGELSELLLNGQKVIPQNLEKENFEFEYKILQVAFKDIIS